jgi:hypothetical protein
MTTQLQRQGGRDGRRMKPGLQVLHMSDDPDGDFRRTFRKNLDGAGFEAADEEVEDGVKLARTGGSIGWEEKLGVMEAQGGVLDSGGSANNIVYVERALCAAIGEDAGELVLEIGDVGGGNASGGGCERAVGAEHLGIIDDLVALEAGECACPLP